MKDVRKEMHGIHMNAVPQESCWEKNFQWPVPHHPTPYPIHASHVNLV